MTAQSSQVSAPTVAEVLDRAADLLTPEGAWTQQTAYRDADGRSCTRERAACMCVLGALWTAGEPITGCGPGVTALEALLGTWPAQWNDTFGRTQAEVVAKLREAASLARQEQGQ